MQLRSILTLRRTGKSTQPQDVGADAQGQSPVPAPTTLAVAGQWGVVVPLFLLVLAVSTDHFGIPIGDTNFRTELIAGGLIFAWLLFRWAIVHGRRTTDDR